MKCVVFNADDTLCSLQKGHLQIPKDCHTYLQSWWRCTVEYTANCLMYREQAIVRLIGFEHWQRLCLECGNPPNGKNNFWLAFQLCTYGIPTVGRRHLAWRGMILKLIDTVPCFDQIFCLFGHQPGIAFHHQPACHSQYLFDLLQGPYLVLTDFLTQLFWICHRHQTPDTRHQTPDHIPGSCWIHLGGNTIHLLFLPCLGRGRLSAIERVICKGMSWFSEFCAITKSGKSYFSPVLSPALCALADGVRSTEDSDVTAFHSPTTSRLVSSSPSPSSSPPVWSHHHAQTLRFPKQGCNCLFCARDTKVHIKLVDIQYSLYSWIEGCTMFRKCILRWGRDLWSDQASDLEQLFSLTHIHKVDFTWMCS